MIFLIVILIVLLTSYLVICAKKWGVPEMISDTYYQGAGAWFSAVLLTEAAGLAPLAADRSLTDFQNVIGMVGLLGLVGVAVLPAYQHCQWHRWAHKVSAYVAAIGCVGLALTVSPWPTVACAIAQLLWCICTKKHRWYVAECLCFADVFATGILSSI